MMKHGLKQNRDQYENKIIHRKSFPQMFLSKKKYNTTVLYSTE